MGWSAAEKARHVGLFIESGKSIVIFQRKCRQEKGSHHSHVPGKNQIKAWYEKFEKGEGMNRKKKAKNKVRESLSSPFIRSFIHPFPTIVLFTSGSGQRKQ